MKLRPKPEITKCSSCTLQAALYVPPWLLPTPELPILWVGQGPGGTEAITGIPFTGRAGKMQYSLMLNAGLHKNKNNFTNVVGCVAKNEKGEDRDPSVLEASCCKPRLVQEIQLCQPELIIALGKPAMRALTGCSNPIKDMRAQLLPLLPEYKHQCQVYICLHPSFVMRQRQWIDIAIDDLSQITKLLRQPTIEIIKEQPDFNLKPTPQELAQYLETKENLSFDLETTGLNPRLDQIIACGFSDGKTATVFNFNDWSCREVAMKYLEDRDAPKSTQNGSFDCAFLRTNDIHVRGLAYDTRLAEHLLNSDLPTDLQFLRKQYTSIPPYKRSKRELSKLIKTGRGQVSDVECAWDAYTTNRVMKQQSRLLSAGQRRVHDTIYLPLIFTLNEMTRKGVGVNVPALQILYSRLAPVAQGIFEKHFLPIKVNPRSPRQLAKLWGVESTDADSLEAMIKRNHPDAERMQALLDFREMATQANKVLKGTYTRMENEYVHTNFKPDGTGTGRISSSDPALQNVRKEFRVIFISDDPEHVLVQADYNQLELVVAAILGEEWTLLGQIKNGIKPHHVLGQVIYGRPWDQLTDIEKLREKAVLFGTMGGRGARSIAMEFNVSTAQAREWQDKCVGTYPGLLKYQQDCLEEFKQTGKITTAFGTERKVQGPTQAMNNRFQGSASFVTLTTLNELAKAGFDLRLTVHDSIIWQCRKEDVVESVRQAKEIIERPIPELKNWQFRCKVEAGRNWFEMEEVK